eukprot:3867018-Ditylum_brightwellii.AAC.1
MPWSNLQNFLKISSCDVSQLMKVDWRSGDNVAVLPLILTHWIAHCIDKMRGKTKAGLLHCVGEKIPSPPCACGRVAKLCAYSRSATLCDAVWSTEHVKDSIMLENSNFQAWQP